MNKKILFALVLVLSVASGTPFAHADSLLTTVTTGANPDVAASVGNVLYVADVGDNTVTAINTANNFSTATINVGTEPEGILALGTKVYVSNFLSNTVSVIDTANNNSVSTVSVGTGPFGMLAMGTKVYVGDYTDGNVTIIDTANANATSTVRINGTQLNSLLAIGSKIYIAHTGGTPSVYVIDTANNNATSSIGITSSYFLAAIGTTLYVPDGVNAVGIVNTANGNTTSSVSVAAHAKSITTLGSKVYTLGPNADTLSIIDTSNGNSVTSLSGGLGPVTVAAFGQKIYFTQGSSGGTLTMLDTANGNARSSFPSVGGPNKISFLSPYIFVSNNPAGHVSVYVQQYTVTYQAGSNGSLTGSTIQAVNVGSSTTPVTAVPQAGYHFVNWSDGSTANPRTDLSVSADATVTANFASDPAVSSSGGSVSIDDLAKMLTPGPATDAYLASRGLKIKSSGNSVQSPTAISSSTSGFMIDLGPGSVGPDVRKIQQYLNTHGFVITSSGPGSLGNESDRFGVLTLSAVRRFQKAHGIPATGYVGPLTRKVLNQ